MEMEQRITSELVVAYGLCPRKALFLLGERNFRDVGFLPLSVLAPAWW